MTITEAEKKLAAYRARKNREALLNRYRAQVKSMFSRIFPKNDDKPEDTSIVCFLVPSNVLCILKWYCRK